MIEIRLVIRNINFHVVPFGGEMVASFFDFKTHCISAPAPPKSGPSDFKLGPSGSKLGPSDSQIRPSDS